MCVGSGVGTAASGRGVSERLARVPELRRGEQGVGCDLRPGWIARLLAALASAARCRSFLGLAGTGGRGGMRRVCAARHSVRRLADHSEQEAARAGLFRDDRRRPGLGPRQPVRQAPWAVPARVCNGVCNRPGHNLTRSGTTWHDRGPRGTPQPPPRGTHGHDLTRSGTTWHDRGLMVRVLQDPSRNPPRTGEKRPFGGDCDFAADECATECAMGRLEPGGLRSGRGRSRWVRGTIWHDLAQRGTAWRSTEGAGGPAIAGAILPEPAGPIPRTGGTTARRVRRTARRGLDPGHWGDACASRPRSGSEGAHAASRVHSLSASALRGHRLARAPRTAGSLEPGARTGGAGSFRVSSPSVPGRSSRAVSMVQASPGSRPSR
jgi:hypothetical protein